MNSRSRIPLVTLFLTAACHKERDPTTSTTNDTTMTEADETAPTGDKPYDLPPSPICGDRVCTIDELCVYLRPDCVRSQQQVCGADTGTETMADMGTTADSADSGTSSDMIPGETCWNIVAPPPRCIPIPAGCDRHSSDFASCLEYDSDLCCTPHTFQCGLVDEWKFDCGYTDEYYCWPSYDYCYPCY